MAARRSSARNREIVSRYTSASDAELIELARQRFKQATSADNEQRQRELEDLEFYAGKQWPQDVINAREGQPGNATTGLPPIPARPTYVINKVREPVRQILNQERNADLGVEIAAADDFGDETPGVSPQEIELREGLVRKIQRESQAQDARSWAFARSVIAGRGYYRVMTRYVPGKTNDQEVYVDRIYNQASVVLDPTHEQPDGSDAEWGFIGSDIPWDRYKAEYGEVGDRPNPLVTASQQEWRALGDELPGWFMADGEQRSVRVVEYWYTSRKNRELLTLTDGTVVFQDELPEGTKPDIAVDEDTGEPMRRSVTEKQIQWAKIDGVQVLEQTDWPGHYLPIVKILGEELQPYDSQRRAEGMVRPSRDSQRGFNVMVSKWVEQIGLAPIPPWMGAAGFDEGFEPEYALANTRTLSALHYNTKDLEGNPIPPPTRTSITMEIQAIAGSVQLFDAAIKSTTAVPDPTLGNVDPSLKSGKAIKEVIQQAVKGTSHYLDNLSRSVRYEGLIINDLLYPVYTRKGRVVRVMNPKGETQPVMLHRPFVRHPETKQPIALDGARPVTVPTPNPQLYTLTPDATFNVTVKVTKNFDTRREQQEDLLTTLVEADPQQMTVIGDLLFKYSDAPGHEDLEQRYKAMLAPPIQALVAGKAQLPPQVQAQIGQAQKVIQELTAHVNQLTEIVQQKQVEGKTKLTEAQMDNDTKIKIAWINASAQLAATGAKLDAENARSYVDAIEKRGAGALDAAMQHIQHAHEAATLLTGNLHEQQMQAADQAHESDLATQAAATAAAQQAAAPSPAQPGA